MRQLLLMATSLTRFAEKFKENMKKKVLKILWLQFLWNSHHISTPLHSPTVTAAPELVLEVIFILLVLLIHFSQVNVLDILSS